MVSKVKPPEVAEGQHTEGWGHCVKCNDWSYFLNRNKKCATCAKSKKK